MDFFEKSHRHEPQEPQLAAMIDVFSILIIFLIAGTVMGTSSITLPDGLKLPDSLAKETLDTAPQITLSSESATLSFDEKPYRLSDLRSGGTEKSRFVGAVRTHLGANSKKPLKAINLVADRHLPYSTVFEATKMVREAGFESIYFISSVSSSK